MTAVTKRRRWATVSGNGKSGRKAAKRQTVEERKLAHRLSMAYKKPSVKEALKEAQGELPLPKGRGFKGQRTTRIRSFVQ